MIQDRRDRNLFSPPPIRPNIGHMFQSLLSLPRENLRSVNFLDVIIMTQGKGLSNEWVLVQAITFTLHSSQFGAFPCQRWVSGKIKISSLGSQPPEESECWMYKPVFPCLPQWKSGSSGFLLIVWFCADHMGGERFQWEGCMLWTHQGWGASQLVSAFFKKEISLFIFELVCP